MDRTLRLIGVCHGGHGLHISWAGEARPIGFVGNCREIVLYSRSLSLFEEIFEAKKEEMI